MLEALNEIMNCHWPAALQGNPAAIDICARVLNMQALILINP